MKLNKLFTLIIVLSMLLALVPAASAQGPAGDWVSGIACQNLDEVNDADVTLSFYLEDSGASSLDYNDTIPAGGSKNYYTPSSPPGVPDGFLGSVAIQSSAPLACNVNTQTTGTGTSSDPFRIATSAGFSGDETSPTMYAPQVMKTLAGAWSSYVAVQNATASAVDVTLTYKDRDGNAVPAADESFTIPGYSNHVFYQEDNAGLPANFIGAATISSTGAVAVTVNFYNDGLASGTSQLHSYNGFAAGGTSLLIPRFVRRFYGYNSGLAIQNVGTNPTNVTVTFTFAGVTYVHVSPEIQPGAAYAIYAYNIAELLPVDSLALSQRFGSAVATSFEPVIITINEDNRGDPADNNGDPVPPERIGQGTTYNGFLNGIQTMNVFFAQIVKAASVFSGGFQVANTTATPGSCTATFNAVTPPVTYDFTLEANGSASVYAPNVPGLPATYNGSVSVVCDVEVVGISNLAAAPGTGGLGDSFTQGNGLNR